MHLLQSLPPSWGSSLESPALSQPGPGCCGHLGECTVRKSVSALPFRFKKGNIFLKKDLEQDTPMPQIYKFTKTKDLIEGAKTF